jgi:predicted RNA-binding protein
MEKLENNLIKIKGIIIPFDWDEKGKVVAVAVSTYDEDVYLVDRQEKGLEMLDLLQEQVEIRGELRRENHKKIIIVKKYTLKPAKHKISIH